MEDEIDRVGDRLLSESSGGNCLRFEYAVFRHVLYAYIWLTAIGQTAVSAFFDFSFAELEKKLLV